MTLTVCLTLKRLTGAKKVAKRTDSTIRYRGAGGGRERICRRGTKKMKVDQRKILDENKSTTHARVRGRIGNLQQRK